MIFLNKKICFLVFDSSAKYPYGILEGLTRHLGIFDQCHRIHTTIPNNENNEEIRGRYCLVDIEYHEKNESANVSEYLDIWFDSHGSAWEAIRVIYLQFLTLSVKK